MNRNKLKGLRVERGLTQEDMAKKLGVSTVTYTLKENGKRNFNDDEISKIAEILNVEVSIFFESKR